MDKLIAVPRYGSNESRLTGIVAEGAPQGSNRLRERAVGNDDVSPDVRENRVLRDCLPAPNDQQQQQVEVARDQRYRPSAPEQQPLTRRDRELAKDEPDAWCHEV